MQQTRQLWASNDSRKAKHRPPAQPPCQPKVSIQKVASCDTENKANAKDGPSREEVHEIIANIEKEYGPAKVPDEEEKTKEGPPAVGPKKGSFGEPVKNPKRARPMEEVREEKVEEVSTAPAKKKHKVKIKRKERWMRGEVASF